MSQADAMYHTDRLDIYKRSRRHMTGRQAHRYFRKLNRHYGPPEGETPRRADAIAARLERRRAAEAGRG